MALLRERTRVVLREEVAHHAAEVLQEPLRRRDVLQDVAREGGHEGPQRVAAPLLELRLHLLRPVLRSDLEGVDEDVVEARRDVARERTERPAEARHVLLEVVVQRLGGELVHLKPAPVVGGGVVAVAVAEVAHAQDRPVARRDVPRERAVRPQVRRQVAHRALRDDLVGRRRRRVARHLLAHGERLRGEVREPRAPFGMRLLQRGLHARLHDLRAERPHRRLLREGVEAEGRVARARAREREAERLERPERRAVLGDLKGNLRVGAPRPPVVQAEREARRLKRLRARHREAVRLDLRRHVRERRLLGGRRGEREDADVRVEAVVVRLARQLRLELRRARRRHLSEGDALHAVRRRVPRPARARPARAVRNADLKPKAARLRRGMAEHLEPRRRVEVEPARRDRAPGVEHLHAADARARQLLEVARQALLRDVAVHHVEPGVGLRRGRRRLEALLQVRVQGSAPKRCHEAEHRSSRHVVSFPCS